LQTEREGFEPSDEVDPRHAISSRARSTAPAPLRASRGALQGYAKRYSAETVLLAASQAFSKTFGLIITFFVGIGGIVGGLIAYIAIQIRGERQQNEQYRAERGQRFGA
jgi:hypothetical protein